MIAPGEPLIKVDVGLSAGAVVDKQFLGAGGPGETPDRTAGQAQLPGGLRQVPALGQQAVHVSVPGPASDSPGSRQLQGCRLAGRRGRRALGLDRGGQLLAVPLTARSTASARLCHRCQRSATWTACGAPRVPRSE